MVMMLWCAAQNFETIEQLRNKLNGRWNFMRSECKMSFGGGISYDATATWVHFMSITWCNIKTVSAWCDGVVTSCWLHFHYTLGLDTKGYTMKLIFSSFLCDGQVSPISLGCWARCEGHCGHVCPGRACQLRQPWTLEACWPGGTRCGHLATSSLRGLQVGSHAGQHWYMAPLWENYCLEYRVISMG